MTTLIGTYLGGWSSGITVIRAARETYPIEALTNTDMIRMEAIMQQYKDAAFDYTDVAIMAVAERLNITRVCTFDGRDFSIFRPTHCVAFDLLP